MESGARDEDEWDEVQAALISAGVTDGLPVVPPSARRVGAMIQDARVDPDAVIAVIPPSYAPVTWRDAAVNAVMAGCAPAYLRVVGAAVAAIAAPEFNLLGIATTTGSATVCVMVNGPIVTEIGMNSGANALGPGNRANATIGRAIQLIIRNMGEARPGEIDMATLGQPGKYAFCLAENEAHSPWPPLHVERGFAAHSNVVTVMGVSGTIEVVDSDSLTPEEIAQTFAGSMLIAGHAGGSGLLGGGEPLIILPPELANVFAHAGLSKAQAKKLIWDRALLPVERCAPARLGGAMANNALQDGNLRVAAKADDIMLVVAGGVGRKGCYVPTWSGSTIAVSREVG